MRLGAWLNVKRESMKGSLSSSPCLLQRSRSEAVSSSHAKPIGFLAACLSNNVLLSSLWPTMEGLSSVSSYSLASSAYQITFRTFSFNNGNKGAIALDFNTTAYLLLVDADLYLRVVLEGATRLHHQLVDAPVLQVLLQDQGTAVRRQVEHVGSVDV